MQREHEIVQINSAKNKCSHNIPQSTELTANFSLPVFPLSLLSSNLRFPFHSSPLSSCHSFLPFHSLPISLPFPQPPPHQSSLPPALSSPSSTSPLLPFLRRALATQTKIKKCFLVDLLELVCFLFAACSLRLFACLLIPFSPLYSIVCGCFCSCIVLSHRAIDLFSLSASAVFLSTCLCLFLHPPVCAPA